ncbi:histidine-phosphotransfer domain HPT domain-containing protein [Chiua virens]|nr:histidine-phosphotransfer domain HPT domain-containing protein [Chiua virens]
MSSRFADPTTMRTRSPIYHDESPKRPPPSPSNKAPPSKKLDAKSRAVSEEPCSLSKAPLAVIPPSPESHLESCTDKSPSHRVVVDEEVFSQILELDDGDNQEFSQGMVDEYLKQAQSTVKLMDDCFTKHELTQLGKHGHFLKGSSAALGVVQLQEICEKIQHLGNRMDPDTEVKISAEEAFAKIKPLLARLKEEHAIAAKYLKKFFEGSKP